MAGQNLEKIYIIGENFGTDPGVMLNDLELLINSWSDISIEAELPREIEPGTYHLLVAKKGKFREKQDTSSMDVTIGAVGPLGPPGPPGPTGDKGTDGVAGTNGTNGIDGEDGAPGADGISCWDTNENGKCDTTEQGDDGVCGVSDCKGEPGSEGPQGAAGVELTNYDYVFEAHACDSGCSFWSTCVMKLVKNSFCYLSKVKVDETDTEGEYGQCNITTVNSGGELAWYLVASVGGGNTTVKCEARCVTW